MSLASLFQSIMGGGQPRGGWNAGKTHVKKKPSKQKTVTRQQNQHSRKSTNTPRKQGVIALLGIQQKKRKGSVIAYHGTPSTTNAGDIIRNGFLAGTGNALGSGVYFSTNLAEAKSYSRGSGVYLKCIVQLGRSCTWDAKIQNEYVKWCRDKNVIQDQNARSAFLLHKRIDTLQADSVIVVPRPQFSNPTAHKVKLRQVKIIGVYRADNDQKIRV
ncbi:MAG: hypothetical protein A2511_12435 [Deltaproteobacteria bacterium RIFOXYD12_FULL_50_9]|nr:MAG: hypothetical protein A2511_12435 [Deltaproteobacteria bacterium RIFOXYD12_FULL_50_9]